MTQESAKGITMEEGTKRHDDDVKKKWESEDGQSKSLPAS